MNALQTARAFFLDTTCPECHGAGEVHTGQIEAETGHASLVTCDLCGGAGEFDADVEDAGDKAYRAGRDQVAERAAS